MQQTLDSNVSAPSLARQIADSFLAESSINPSTRRTIRLVVSELVTNAVQHGSPPIQLKLNLDQGRLVVEVRDDGALFPLEPSPPDHVSRGRGLLLVAELSTRWGARSHLVGKTVWCDVILSAEAVPNSRQGTHTSTGGTYGNRDADVADR